jgi:hypothetical protein
MKTLQNHLRNWLCRLGLHGWESVAAYNCENLRTEESCEKQRCQNCFRTRTVLLDHWEQALHLPDTGKAMADDCPLRSGHPQLLAKDCALISSAGLR